MHDAKTHDTNINESKIDNNPADNDAASDTVSTRPLSIEVQRWRQPHNRDWACQAFAKVTPTLRTSGLLHALPSEELKTLLCILTFTTSGGECRPTVTQIAHALDISEAKARRRLEHLLSFQWQGRGLITLLCGEDGLEAYLPALGTIAPPDVSYLEQPPQVPGTPVPRRGASALANPVAVSIPAIPKTAEATEDTVTPTKRQQIVAASQRKYGRPRAEVEQMIAEQMGWTTAPAVTSSSPTESSPTKKVNGSLTPQQEELRERLVATGMDVEGINSFMDRFPHEQIERQLNWLPYRDARNPAAFLIAAVEHDYEPPLALRQEPKPHEQRPQNESKANRKAHL